MMVVTLLTDFGLEDPYVAEVKAVLLASGKNIQLIDLCHDIAPYDIEWGAFQLMRSYRFFPKSTYHLAVVDPGVGGERRCLYVETSHYRFVGPDNGLLLWAVRDCEKREGKRAKVFEIPVPEGTAPTFHGRDIFAPFIVQGWRARGQRLTPIEGMKGREFPGFRELDGRKIGEILGFDHFGNAVTSIAVDKQLKVEAQVGHRSERMTSVSAYKAIEDNKAAVIAGSHGFWEIAAKEDSALELLELKQGEQVTVFPVT